eukprot:ANDGO_03129.mRNA.1 Diacylglycerol O-acyltransferase 1
MRKTSPGPGSVRRRSKGGGEAHFTSSSTTTPFSNTGAHGSSTTGFSSSTTPTSSSSFKGAVPLLSSPVLSSMNYSQSGVVGQGLMAAAPTARLRRDFERSKSFDPYDLAHVGPDFEWEKLSSRWHSHHSSSKRIKNTADLSESESLSSLSSMASSPTPANGDHSSFSELNNAKLSSSGEATVSDNKHHKGHSVLQHHTSTLEFADRASLLDSDVPEHSFRGLVNLAILLLVLSNARLVIDNILKYGLLVNFSNMFASFVGDPYSWPSVSLSLFFLVFIACAYVLERNISSRQIKESRGRKFHFANLVGTIVIPIIVIHLTNPHPIGGLVNMMISSILFLKLYSYVMVNSEEREKVWKKIDKKPAVDRSVVLYPHNINLKDLTYFMCVPTLVYDLNYPRTDKIRVTYVVKCLLKFVLIWAVIITLVEQYMVPIVRNSMEPFDMNDFTRITERVLKLAVPNLYVWLLGFYAFFHVYLNMMAELFCFADRRFYSDWWNSNSLDYFWRNWNIPVHVWMVRHVYLPLCKNWGWGRFAASMAIFAISGFFHEIIVSVPFGMVKLWAFFGMMAQIPLAFATRSLTRHRHWGNVIFWISILCGQPLLILFYYRQYYLDHNRDVLLNGSI